MAKRRKLTFKFPSGNKLLIVDDPVVGIFVHYEPKKLPKRGGVKLPSWRFKKFSHATRFCEIAIKDATPG